MTANKSTDKQGPICVLCGLPCSAPVTGNHLLPPKPATAGAMRDRYLQLDTHDLEIVLSFFDCDQLREHYTALIAEMRAERDRRWALDPNALGPEIEAWAQRQREGSK